MGLDLTFGRSLKYLPEGLNKLNHLVYLHLGFCSFTKLPKSLGGLKMLVVLDLGNCANLTHIPNSIGKLKMLVTLNLFQCSALKYLPQGFYSLKRLKSLNLLGCGNVCTYYKPRRHLPRFVNLRNLETDDQTIFPIIRMEHVRSLVVHKCSGFSLIRLEELEDFTVHKCEIKVFDSEMNSFLNLKTLRLSSLPDLHSLGLNNCPNLVNLTLNDCLNLENVAVTNCPNLVCLPALDSLPSLSLLVLQLSIKKLPQSFTHPGAFPALNIFDLRHSKLVEFPEVEEGAMPKLQWLDFDDCIFLHSLPASISLLTSIHTIELGSKNEKLITSCKTEFRNLPIRKNFIVDGKPLIPEEEVFEPVVPMEEDTTTVPGSEKRPFQKVHGDDEERLLKRGGSILGNNFFPPPYPKRFVYLGSSSLAETTKSENEHGLCEAL